MKAVVVALLVLSSQALITADSGVSPAPLPAQLALAGPYDHCVKLLQEILLEANEVSMHIVNKDYHKAIAVAVKMSGHIYEDIQCFMEPKINTAGSLNGLADPTECIMKHIRAAAEAVQKALDAITSKPPNFQEAIRQALIAIAHIHEAKQCH